MRTWYGNETQVRTYMTMACKETATVMPKAVYLAQPLISANFLLSAVVKIPALHHSRRSRWMNALMFSRSDIFAAEPPACSKNPWLLWVRISRLAPSTASKTAPVKAEAQGVKTFLQVERNTFCYASVPNEQRHFEGIRGLVSPAPRPAADDTVVSWVQAEASVLPKPAVGTFHLSEN